MEFSIIFFNPSLSVENKRKYGLMVGVVGPQGGASAAPRGCQQPMGGHQQPTGRGIMPPSVWPTWSLVKKIASYVSFPSKSLWQSTTQNLKHRYILSEYLGDFIHFETLSL